MFTMLYINNTVTDPYYNHALEEYFLKNTNEECFILWRSNPCVLIGKNQNAYSEINIDYIKKHNLPVVRRISGGGAIFNDLGNILFGFISNSPTNTFADFKRFTTPIIEALNRLSVKAELSGRNDITIDDKKISGNAQAKYKNRILHHGSLLYSSNMTDLSSALNAKPIKFQDKGIKSIASRVTNISDYLKTPMDVVEFKDFILNHIMETDASASIYNLTESDLFNIRKLAKEKTSTWEWNFGNSPKYDLINEKKFVGGVVEINLNVKNGYIVDSKIYGDFFGQDDIITLEAALKGVKHNEADIRFALSVFDISKYLTNITLDNLIELMFYKYM
jgi:lipoate---protein ligase